MKLEEKCIESRSIYEGKILHYRLDKVELPNGRIAEREVVAHQGAVGILPILPDGRIVMVRQYRYAPGRVMLEVPAGKLERGEDPLECAKRELEEETGYQAGNFAKLAAFFTAPGFCDELLHLYLATGLVKTEQNLDEDEFLNVETYTREEVKGMIERQEIVDGKTLIALLMTEAGYA